MAIRSKAGAALLAAGLLLSGCSGRDTDLAEKSAAAEQSALRAEKAADRAEAAANKADKASAPVVEAEADVPDDEPVDAIPAEDKPLDPAPTNHS